MAVELSVSEARANLPSLLNRVADGEDVVITRHGEPVAMLVRPDRVVRRSAAVEASFARAAEIERLLEKGRQTPLDELPGISDEQADALIEHVRWMREE